MCVLLLWEVVVFIVVCVVIVYCRFELYKKRTECFFDFVDVFFIDFVQFLNGTTSLLKVGFRERERARA